MIDKCIWEMGSLHHGEVSTKMMFADQISVPICEKHFREHLILMTLLAKGCDAEEVIKSKPEKREDLLKSLVSGGELLEKVISETKA